MPKSAFFLKKPSGAVSIQLNINEQQQKMYNVLLKKAEEALKRDRNSVFYKTQLSEVLNRGGISETNYKRIKEFLLELYNISIEYNILGKDKDMEIEEHAHLLDNLRFIKKGSQITIRYSIPNMVRCAIVKANDGKGIYAIIDLTVIKHLRSKYTIKLYELVKDYINTEIPKMDILKFRKLFGIEKKYTIIADMKKRVLDSACKELNENEEIDFLVKYNLIKTGQKYTHIKFIVRAKPQKMKLEQQKTELLQQEAQENPDLQELLLLLPSELRNTKVTQTILGALQEKDKNYIQAQIQYCLSVKEKKGITNFSGYLKKALENDYAGVEVVEVKAPKKEKNINDYIEKWFVVNNIGYCIIEIAKEGNKINVVAEEKGTGVKKQFKFENLETLESYIE